MKTQFNDCLKQIIKHAKLQYQLYSSKDKNLKPYMSQGDQIREGPYFQKLYKSYLEEFQNWLNQSNELLQNLKTQQNKEGLAQINKFMEQRTFTMRKRVIQLIDHQNRMNSSLLDQQHRMNSQYEKSLSNLQQQLIENRKQLEKIKYEFTNLRIKFLKIQDITDQQSNKIYLLSQEKAGLQEKIKSDNQKLQQYQQKQQQLESELGVMKLNQQHKRLMNEPKQKQKKQKTQPNSRKIQSKKEVSQHQHNGNHTQLKTQGMELKSQNSNQYIKYQNDRLLYQKNSSTKMLPKYYKQQTEKEIQPQRISNSQIGIKSRSKLKNNLERFKKQRSKSKEPVHNSHINYIINQKQNIGDITIGKQAMKSKRQKKKQKKQKQSAQRAQINVKKFKHIQQSDKQKQVQKLLQQAINQQLSAQFAYFLLVGLDKLLKRLGIPLHSYLIRCSTCGDRLKRFKDQLAKLINDNQKKSSQKRKSNSKNSQKEFAAMNQSQN